MADSGGIGSRVAGELKNIATGVVKDVGKLTTDVASGTMESLTSGSSSPQNVAGSHDSGKASEAGASASDPQAIKQQQRLAAEKRRFNEVLAELAEFKQKREQEERQKQQVMEEEKKMRELQHDESKKKRGLASLLRNNANQYGGTGEVAKKKG